MGGGGGGESRERGRVGGGVHSKGEGRGNMGGGGGGERGGGGKVGGCVHNKGDVRGSVGGGGGGGGGGVCAVVFTDAQNKMSTLQSEQFGLENPEHGPLRSAAISVKNLNHHAENYGPENHSLSLKQQAEHKQAFCETLRLFIICTRRSRKAAEPLRRGQGRDLTRYGRMVSLKPFTT